MAWDQIPRDPEQQDGFDALGAMVLRRRAWLGWSQRYLEAQSGVDQTVISRIENGKQYGLRWSRFATLVGSMGGLDVPASARIRVGRETKPAEPADRLTEPPDRPSEPPDRPTEPPDHPTDSRDHPTDSRDHPTESRDRPRIRATTPGAGRRGSTSKSGSTILATIDAGESNLPEAALRGGRAELLMLRLGITRRVLMFQARP